MAELIGRQKAIDAVVEAHCYGTDIMEALQNLRATTEAEIRNKAIDEFAEKLKADYINYDIYMILENNNIMYSSASVVAFKQYIDEIAEQLKEK